MEQKIFITQDLIDQLIVKYTDLSDYWDIAAAIINEIYPREDKSDAEFYYYVHAIWELIDDYARRDRLKNWHT
jgi:hypothetical protein